MRCLNSAFHSRRRFDSIPGMHHGGIATSKGSAPFVLRVIVLVTAWALALVNLYYFRVADPDFWMHVRSGADILQSGQIRQVDTYSFTAAGLPIINHEWLADVLIAWTFHTGTLWLIGLKMLVGIACLLVLWRLIRLRTDDLRVTLPLFLFGAHVIGRSLLFRPQIFSYLFFAITLLVLERHRQHPTRSIWTLPLLIFVWANVHAGFVAGLALIGFYWLASNLAGHDAPRRPSLSLGGVLLVAGVATLLNPYGTALWACIARTVLDPLGRRYVQEWQPIWYDLGSWDNRLALSLAVTAIGCLALGRGDRRDTALLLIVTLTGCGATRHLPLFTIVALPLIATSLASPAQGWKRSTVLIAVGGLALLPVLMTARAAVADLRPRISVVDTHYRGFPARAVEFLRRQPSSGNIWNELAWGGYVIWTLSPPWKVSLDGRNLNLYPSAVLRDHFELFTSDAPDLSILDHYPIDVCLFARGRQLANALAASGRWELIYQDDKAVIFRNRASTLRLQSPAEVPGVAPAD